MSGGSVSVLTPNGRRQTVKYLPNTILLQILEEVCKKHGLNPEEYDLKHHNKILDTTTTFRFSGLPNNAQLELVTATKIRADSEITLAVNLEDGNRLIGNFTPNDTLLNILNKLCPESLKQEKEPVIIYTRREIFGKELENVTLRSLGLTGGRAMIRVLHRSPDELKIQANVAVPLPSKPVEEKPYRRTFQRLPSPPKIQDELLKTDSLEDQASLDHGTVKPQRIIRHDNTDILKLAKEKRKSKELDTPPKEEKRKSFSKNTTNINTKSEDSCQCKRDASMEVDCCGKCEEKCTDVNPSNLVDEFIFLGSRNAMLFSLETAQAVPSEDLPDDFFDLTIDDARKILRDVRRQRHNMENAPLVTSTLRNLEESKKQIRQLNRYKKAIMRVQFPDRTVLQGTFATIDTVKDVVEFVRDYLEDTSSKFYLYSTPPKCVLEEETRLIELGFVPGAMVYFATDDQEKKNYLRKDLQDKFTSNSVASLAANKLRSENTRTCRIQEPDDDFDMETDKPVTNDGASTSTGITHEYERKIVKSTQDLPKWFKP